MPRLLLILLATVGVLALGAYWLQPSKAPIGASVAVADALSGDITGYARAYAPRPFVFPEDHGAHPDYKLEWWYYTGNLTATDGRHFGYQFTIFRSALAPPDSTADPRDSNWATRQLYFAHFSLADVASGEFHAFERFSRGAAGLAGAQAAPFRVWIDGWNAREADAGMPQMRVQAAENDIAIDLTLTPTKPLVLQGKEGFSQKGPEPGNASYYYSFTRLATEGTVTVADGVVPVTGLSWMDREWSTSLLGPNQVGWDWFSIQLDDGRDLMYFQLREREPTGSPYTDGLLVAADGQAQSLKGTPVTLEPLETWTSPGSGATYPVRWRLRIPSENLDLTIAPRLSNQELDVAVRYWEGAIEVSGTAGEQSVSGSGYLEMTGYGDNAALPSG